MNVYMVSHEEMQKLHDLRGWLSEIIKTGRLARSQQTTAANFAIDLSEVLASAMCAELQVDDT